MNTSPSLNCFNGHEIEAGYEYNRKCIMIASTFPGAVIFFIKLSSSFDFHKFQSLVTNYTKPTVLIYRKENKIERLSVHYFGQPDKF